MRICVIGAGLAGASLGWRLAQLPSVQLVLAPGPTGAADATAASGGLVRGFEINPIQRRLAIDSLLELLADPVLRDWSGYTRCGSLYLPASADGLEQALAELEADLPGSAQLIDTADLANRGWAELEPGTVGVLEAEAGYLNPDRLRRSLLAELSEQPNVTVLPAGEVTGLGGAGFTLAGVRYDYDVVVLATGPWTPNLLREHGLDTTGLRTKAIQYTIHQATGMPSTSFVDDRTDLYGKPVPGGVLLGLPTEAWDVLSMEPDLALSAAATELALRRFPQLHVQSSKTPVTAVDCYAASGLLCLRPVDGDRLFTFTGGTGGAAKTALAASKAAAIQLAEGRQDPETPLTLIGRRSESS
jgi:glycine/D-amino acid oxidase-like deaminating enzyme